LGGDARRSASLLSPGAGEDHGRAAGSGPGFLRGGPAEAAAAVFSGGLDFASAQESGPADTGVRGVSCAASGVSAGDRGDARVSYRANREASGGSGAGERRAADRLDSA